MFTTPLPTGEADAHHGITHPDVERTAGIEQGPGQSDQPDLNKARKSYLESFLKKEENSPKWYQKLIDAGVEQNGIQPVPLEGRTLTQYNQLFTVFFTCLLCLLP